MRAQGRGHQHAQIRSRIEGLLVWLRNCSRPPVRLSATARRAQEIAEARPPEALPAALDDDANPAGDGVPNLLKYALGLNPLAPATTGLPGFSLNGSFADFSFTRLRDATDITYIVERSETLAPASWQPIWTSATDPYPDDSSRILEVISRDESGSTKVFYRLNVTRD